MEKVGKWFVPVDNAVTRRSHNLDSAEEYGKISKRFGRRNLALDCGSYIGCWSKKLNQDFDKVIAFEIDPLNAECTRMNAGVEVVEGCLSDKHETVSYAGDREPDSPIYCVSGEGKSAPTIILDELGLTPDFIKLDLQGYETFALWGARETLKRSKPLIYFEHERKCYTRYGLLGSEISEYLAHLGAKQIKVFQNNVLWGWVRSV